MPKCNPKNASAACGLSGSFETSGDGFNFSGSSASCNKKLCCNECKCVEYATVAHDKDVDLFVCRCGTYKLHEYFFVPPGEEGADGAAPVTGLPPLDDVDETYYQKLVHGLNVFVGDCVDGNVLLDLTRVVDYVDATHKKHVLAMTGTGKKFPDPAEWPAILPDVTTPATDFRVGVARLSVFNRGPYTVYLTTKDAESKATFEGVSHQIGCRSGEGLSLVYTPVHKKWIVKSTHGS